jgi:peroxin-6
MFPRFLSSVGPAYSSTLQPDSPFQSLVRLLAATLVPSAVDYDLQAFILLKGARGSGKLALLGWVAQCLGIHLLEVGYFSD